MFMGYGQCFRQLQPQALDFVLCEGACLENFPQRPALNQLHRQKINATLAIEFMDCRDVGVIEFCEDLSFFAEKFSSSFIADSADRQYFDSDVTIELLIVSAVHFSHSTTTDLLDDSVVAERLANHGEGTA
jgi:hypothetical protein